MKPLRRSVGVGHTHSAVTSEGVAVEEPVGRDERNDPRAVAPRMDILYRSISALRFWALLFGGVCLAYPFCQSSGAKRRDDPSLDAVQVGFESR